jgi:hypothetical protein
MRTPKHRRQIGMGEALGPTAFFSTHVSSSEQVVSFESVAILCMYCEHRCRNITNGRTAESETVAFADVTFLVFLYAIVTNLPSK